MNCPRCGRDNRAGAAYCDGCGNPLSTARIPGSSFVGRDDELLALHEALGRAASGQGRLFLIGGEPGIGKSRLAQECAMHAAGLGFQVLWGRCLEDPGAPPYWPWLQLLRAWLNAIDDAHLEEAVGEDGIVLLDLLPELGRRLPGLKQEPPLADATHARFRLFEAIVRLWQRSAGQQPLLLILDNLHAADAASLRLLNFLAPEIAASPLMVFGTWRTSELSRQHPLASTLSELAGHGHARRLVLAGLERHDADRLLAELSGLPEPPATLAAAVFAHSEGNPLFIRELAQTLLQQDLLRPGRNPPGEGMQMPIPEGIRDVLRQRVARLSESCAEVLATAAVIGRRFELELLAGLEAGRGMANLLEALDEALSARLIEELAQPGRYQFSHALIRETLYDELPTTRRLRLHRDIGEQLVALHADVSETGLSRLAWHFAQAAPLGTATRAIDYASRAGGRADALLAYEESVRLYRMALELQERYGDGGDADYCRLLLAMGTAQYRAGEYVQAMATFRNAATNARRRGAAEDLARAALGYEEASWRPGLPGTTARQLLQDALAAVGSGNPRLEARLLSALTRALIFTGEVERSREVQQRAVGLARGLDDPALLAGTLCAGLSARWQPERLEERLETAQEAAVLAERAGD
ncbi:MAG TPA: AAA family ATPase, partial [Gammaproteobacteria bacterium]|nr:AAA family ATPase [Gammaproteobacteria bacterium]